MALLSKGAFNGPAGMETVVDLAWMEAERARPLSDCHGSTVQIKESIPAAVVRLDDEGRPSTVRGRIIALVIDPVQRVFGRWSPAHICEELTETGAPLLGHANAPRAVVLVGLMVFVVAAGLGLAPRAVFREVLALDAVATFALMRLLNQASAAALLACSEREAVRLCRLPAVALAQPSRLLVRGGDAFQHDKASESLTGDVDNWASGSRHRLSIA